MSNLEDWKHRVACNVQVRDAMDVELIARLCADAEDNGKNPAVWHHAAAFYGYTDRCSCHTCSQERYARTRA